MIEELKEYNRIFLLNDRNGKEINGKNYIYHEGRKNIIISAPHAVKQVREGKIKKSDYLTGVLAIYLARKTNCSYFVRVSNANDDPNYPIGITKTQVENLYLNELLKILEEKSHLLLIDLHGCTNDKKYDCNIWSDNFSSCNSDIINIFKESYQNYNLTCNSSSEFLGGQVTRQTMKYSNAFQLEVKKKFRDLNDAENLEYFIQGTETAINKVYKLKK